MPLTFPKSLARAAVVGNWKLADPDPISGGKAFIHFTIAETQFSQTADCQYDDGDKLTAVARTASEKGKGAMSANEKHVCEAYVERENSVVNPTAPAVSR